MKNTILKQEGKTLTQGSPAITRVRHENVRKRTLDVISVKDITPNMRRIVLHSPELHDFVSSSPDDHVKLFFPSGAEKPLMKDYTPRSFDTEANTLTIDFAMHELDDIGPATLWALNAKRGTQLTIGGPRGSAVISDAFDWYLLIGDETALPAIGRRIEESRAKCDVISLVVVDSELEKQTFVSKANWTGHWVFRDIDGQDDAENLSKLIASIIPSSGNGFVWIAAEAIVAKSLRAYMVDTQNFSINSVKASGYWVK
ncbi:MAG: NADPH-dependent ferric siderophore reductase [Robiginitomaculum sp.]|nr:MAG: NADPH-dependent ferric siderophore reductase [Robiginitomaculum sp.]